MRFLFAVYATAGHLRAPLATARLLRARGHALTFFSANDAGAELARVAPEAPRRSLFPAASYVENAGRLRARWNDPVWVDRWVQLNFLGTVREQLAVLEAMIVEHRPDVIVTDPYVLAGSIAATRAGLPWAALHTNFSLIAPVALTGPLASEGLARSRDRLLGELGVSMRFHGALAISPAANLVFADPAFASPDGELAAPVCLAGPLPLDQPEQAGFPWERIDGRPLVYASGGWLQPLPAPIIDALIAATGRLGAQLVVTRLGARDLASSPHVLGVDFAPQQALLARARVFVTHGGANSVTEALLTGCPMLVCPISAEQPLNAYLVERAGLGRTHRDGTPPIDALLTELFDPAHPTRARAAAVRATLDPTATLPRAADVLEALVGE